MTSLSCMFNKNMFQSVYLYKSFYQALCLHRAFTGFKKVLWHCLDTVFGSKFFNPGGHKASYIVFISRTWGRIAFLFLISHFAMAQFAPQVGYGSNDAILKDSSIIKSWATECTLNLGKQNISDANSPLVSLGTAASAVGKAGTAGVVSLGDGGSAILGFAKPISNSPGADFAIFENGFTIEDVGNAFLELAFVEVSSDGINYFRFPSISNTDTSVQIGTYGTLDARRLQNLAGKYVSGYGTPFDLEELKTISGLDVNQITHVKIIDVVGSIQNEYATKDSRGVKVNDPWPTDFASSGFDLDAVAVINEGIATSISQNQISDFTIFPNPVSNGQALHLISNNGSLISEIRLTNAIGQHYPIAFQFDNDKINLFPHDLKPGIYFLHITAKNSLFAQKIIISE